MAQNRGKKFEEQFKKNWEETVENSFFFRLNDQVSGYIGTSRNPCDFICYKKPLLFLLETKSIHGNTFSTEFRQYDELIKYSNIDGVHPGVIIWFCDHDKVVYVPIETFKKLKDDGKKSFNVKYIGSSEYEHLDIPSKKLRVFLNTDYSKLIEYCEEKDND